MGTSEVQRGAVAARVRENIRRIRLDRQLTGAQVAERLARLGRPMQATAVNKIETGARRVDVDDVVALALALNTTPNRLLLDEPGNHDADLELTPRVTAAGFQAWAWANGAQALLAASIPLGEGDEPFGELQRDFLRHVKTSPHPAQAAADDVRGTIGAFLDLVSRHAQEGARSADTDAGRNAALDHLVVAAEELRQGLNRLEKQIGQVIEESPLADQPEYGAAFFATAQVHDQTVTRLTAAFHAATTERTMVMDLTHEMKTLTEARDHASHALATASPDDADAARARLQVAESDLQITVGRLAQAQASAELAANQSDAVQRELYELRRMMLIRHMVPPQLPIQLAFVDQRHPTTEHAKQAEQLWEQLNRSRLAQTLARRSQQ